MNTERAKKVLLLFRPGMDDPTEPETAASLAQAGADAELADWAREQQHWHESVREQFASIEPPLGLRAQLLAMRPQPESNRWWMQPLWLALPAAAALVIGLFINFVATPKVDNRFPAYRNWMARVALREYRMDLSTNSLPEIRRYLATHRGHGDFSMPAGLRTMPQLGCRVFTWHNHPVSLICFEKPDQELVWLFVTQRGELDGAPPGEEPVFVPVGALATASWSNGNETYLVATKGDLNLVRGYF